MSEVNEGSSAVAETINVTTVSTRGVKMTISIPKGTEWGTLKKLLQAKNYTTEGVKFVEGTKKHTLEHANAVLPEEDFYLFMMPLKNKSGAKAKAEVSVKDQVKALFAADKEHAKAHFGNYTQVKAPALAELLGTYVPRTKTEIKAASKPAKVVKPVGAKKSKAIAGVVASVVAVKEEAPPKPKVAIDPDKEMQSLLAGFPDVRL